MVRADNGNIKAASGSQEVLVCPFQQLRERRKLVVTVQGRSILLVYHKGAVYALDKKCYHAGGPLDHGEIKDIEDSPCVVCPWHKYILKLETGEGMYQSIDPYNPRQKPEWKSKGLKQRTHHVEVKDGNVFLTLSDLTQPVESDHYYSEEYKQGDISIKVPVNWKKS